MLGKQESMDVQQNQQKGEENTSSNNILSGTGGLTLADHEAVAEINKANEVHLFLKLNNLTTNQPGPTHFFPQISPNEPYSQKVTRIKRVTVKIAKKPKNI